MKIELNSAVCADALEILKFIESDSIDLIFTSPPYADRRKSSYDGVSEDKYVQWFLPIASEIKRVMKPTGSFFLNIKPHANKGERVLYVFDLVLSLKREIGFWFIDELCWTKNAFPGKLKGRFKNGFEPIYHFTKENPNNITFNPIACGTKVKDETIARTYRKQCGIPENGSGMAALDATNLRNLELARPSNVINVNNVSNQFSDKQKHPGTFPEGLVEFFIKSFSNENDIIIDPFCGSGTVGIVCKKLNRKYILIDNKKEYIELTNNRISK